MLPKTVLSILRGLLLRHAETSRDSTYPDLRTRRYRAPLEDALRTVETTVREQTTYGRSWRFVRSRTEGKSRMIDVEIPVVVFTDDMEIEVRSIGADVVVDVRSGARIGIGDLGENARHVGQLLRALDRRLRPSGETDGIGAD